MSYIEIPKISVLLPIYHGTEEEKMKKGVGHLKNTSLPIGGKNTHCVLTGHTGLFRAEIFTRINELEFGDYFYITTLEQKLTYIVKQIKIVLPEQTEDLKIIKEKDLVTLVTCTPYGINTHRLLVQGERIEENPIENTNIIYKQNKKIEKWIFGIIIIILIILLIKVLKNKYQD